VTRSRLGEVGRFGVVGLAAYATDLLVFNALLLGAGVASVPAKVIAGAVAIAVAYAGSRWWTWRDRRGPDVGREYALFLLFSVLAAGLQVACLVVSREVLGQRSPWADNVSANVVGMAVATAFRFWTFRTFVFPDRRRRQTQPAPAHDTPAAARPATAGGDLRAAGGGTPAPARDAARS
jgi:putative flippase GtrA